MEVSLVVLVHTPILPLTVDHLHPYTSPAPLADGGPTCGHVQTQADSLWQNLKADFYPCNREWQLREQETQG